MKNQIPTYSLQKVASLEDIKQQIFFTETVLSDYNAILQTPYRSDYFGLSICLQGTSTLKADLEEYQIVKNSLIAMSPQVIKQWISRTDDYTSYTIFFKQDLFLSTLQQKDFFEQFIFFQNNEKHSLHLKNDKESEEITAQFENIKKVIQGNHAYKTEMLIHQISILLFQFQSIFQTEDFTKNSTQTRSQQLTIDFKKLVKLHYKKEHSVKFYAEQMFITAKHLSEIIKNETGKTAGEWIDENIVLEAKVLLSNPQLTINQIAFELGFADQSSFGKFFKNITQVSPKEYKQSL